MIIVSYEYFCMYINIMIPLQHPRRACFSQIFLLRNPNPELFVHIYPLISKVNHDEYFYLFIITCLLWHDSFSGYIWHTRTPNRKYWQILIQLIGSQASLDCLLSHNKGTTTNSSFLHAEIYRNVLSIDEKTKKINIYK